MFPSTFWETTGIIGHDHRINVQCENIINMLFCVRFLGNMTCPNLTNDKTPSAIIISVKQIHLGIGCNPSEGGEEERG